MTGKILEVNSEITESGGDDPGLINSSPYEDGWIVKIEIMDPSELDTLLDSEAYAALVG